MPFCHGRGDVSQPQTCCQIPAPGGGSQRCPLLVEQIDGRIFDASGNDLGTTTQFINSLTNNGAARNRAQAQAQGIRFACMAAIRVIVANASLLNNREAFNQAWNTQADYVAVVRPHWAALEAEHGWPAGSYQCSTWGPGLGQCCFSQDEATNEAEAAGLSTVAVQVRRAGGG